MRVEQAIVYNYVDLGGVDVDLICQLCNLPLVNPKMHTLCGMTFCSQCIEQSAKCPSCNEDSLKETFIPAPKNIINMLSKLQVSCQACGQVMCRGDFQDHQDKCPARIPPPQEQDQNKPIHLNLRGTLMTILPKPFVESTFEPNNLFKKMFTGEIPMHSTPSAIFTDPVYFIDIDSNIFKHVLNWFSSGVFMEIPQSERIELEHVCEVFELVNLKKQVAEKSLEERFKIDSIILKDVITNHLMSDIYLAVGCKTVPELLYRGSRDGFKAVDFHARCDLKGPTLTIVRSEYGNIFGGFTSQCWVSLERPDWSPDDSSFLFKIENSTFSKFMTRNQICQEYAIGCGKKDLCVFGAGHDLIIKDECNIKESSSNIGRTYEAPKGFKHESEEAKSYLGGKAKFKVSEIEVFAIPMTHGGNGFLPPPMVFGFF